MVYQIYAGYTVEGVMIKVPQVYIPNVARATVIAHCDAGKLLHQLHFACLNAAPTISDCDTINAVIHDWVQAHYVHCVTNQTIFDAVTTRGMNAYTATKRTLSLDGVAGSYPGPPLPAEVSLVARLGTSSTGRSQHGRAYTFAPGVSAGDSIGNPAGSYVALVEDLWTSLVDAAATASLPMIIASYTRIGFLPVTDITVDQDWDRQGRRAKGRGV